ncbi:hypothetical protein [Solimicrobium silvestre]|uniref:Uncharacterized protein n=1 Tax=Solimicrobium silvestre TaxID=2099400 RepID=A0A2S9GS88_9BURK|nr:hypothetical protein [Solimicrobium silvestre]PRC90581.1 hypothetical protein S2091_4708 [Solimicrobium silvestre]
MSAAQLFLAMTFSVSLIFFTEEANADTAGASVVFVGCPGDGQTGPVPPPEGTPVLVKVESKVASRLAYYRGEFGPGTFAPKGWQCRLWYGSNGSFLIVTPTAPPATFPPHPISAEGVVIMGRDGETSGRFEVAEISARFFPDVMKEFIQYVKDEKLTQSNIETKPYPQDVINKVSDRMVEFTTPANLDGFGTGMFAKSDQSIRGVAALSPESEGPNIIVLRMRLAKEQRSLTDPIIKIMESCIQKSTGC